MLGLPRFAVSVYPERTLDLTVNPSWEVMFAFAVINADLLLLEDHALGTWFDQQRRRHVLDVVICPSSLEKAIRLGLRHGQKAIFDLRAVREIPIVGVANSNLNGEEN